MVAYGDIGKHYGKNTLMMWIYSKFAKMEIRQGSCHSGLKEGEEPWAGTDDELARGKFDMDMKRGSVAFNVDDFRIQKIIADELRLNFPESTFYVYDSPSKYGGKGVLLEKFLGEDNE